MKKSRSPLFNLFTLDLFAGILALVFSASCSLGLEPARNDTGSGTLSLSLATLPGYSPRGALTDSAGRAVVQGGGYLYIRPLGGPGGTGAKRYYGPYQIRSTSSGYDLFKTTDIPGGSYSGLAVLFAASPVESVPVTLPSGETTLGAVLSLPDADFLAAVTADLSDGLTAFDIALDDSASFAITGATTIRPNSTTNLSVTLVPATNKVLFAIEGGGLSYERNENHRAFIRVKDLKALFGSMNPGTSSLAITVQNPLAQGVTLSAFAAYRANGSLIPGSVATNIPLASEQTTYKTAAWDGNDTGYLYVEFNGTALNFSFEAIVPKSVNASVSILDDTISSEMPASIYVLPRILLASDFSPIIDPDLVCRGISVAYCEGITDGNTVSGTLTARDGTGPWIPGAPVAGYVYAVVDGTLWLGSGATETSLTPLGQGTFSAGSAPEFTATTPARHDTVLFNDTGGAYQCNLDTYYNYATTFTNPTDNEIYLFSPSVDWTGVWNIEDPKEHPGCVGYGRAISTTEWTGKIRKSYSGDVHILVSGTYNGNIVRYRTLETQPSAAEIYVDMDESQWTPLMYYVHAINVGPDGHYTLTMTNDFDETDYSVSSGMVIEGDGLFPLIKYGTAVPYSFELEGNYTCVTVDDANLYSRTSPYPFYGSLAIIEINMNP